MPEPSPLELLTLTPDAIISLYVLDLQSIGVNEQYYFCNWKDTGGLAVRFQANDYTAIPLKAEGFEVNSRGQMPTPTLEFGNSLGIITAFTLMYGDLVGAKVIRKRTLAKFLENRPTSNSSSEYEPEHYFVRRKTNESELSVAFELKRSLDMGITTKLPNRYLLKTLCPWEYRKEGCGYTGAPVADINDLPTSDPAKDLCGKRVKSCKLRFGEFAELPYGGFPGIDDF